MVCKYIFFIHSTYKLTGNLMQMKAADSTSSSSLYSIIPGKRRNHQVQVWLPSGERTLKSYMPVAGQLSINFRLSQAITGTDSNHNPR